MLNLIKMNLYRVVRTKCTWILLLITAAICVLGIYLVYVDPTVQEFESGKSEVNQIQEDGELLILKMICDAMQGNYFLIFLCIFVVLYFHGEETSGFIKNLAGRAGLRWQMYLAKYVAVLFFILLGMLAQIAFTVVTAWILVPGAEAGFSILGDVCLYMTVMLVLEMAFAAGVAFLVTLTRNSVISITASILLSGGMGWMVTQLLISRLIWLPEHLEKYQVAYQANILFYNSGGDLLAFGAAVGAVWFVLYSVLGGVLTEKRDMI